MIQTVKVDLPNRSYDILIGSQLLARTGELIRPHMRGSKVVVVTDEIVSDRYLSDVQESLQAHGIRNEHLVLPVGETYKNWSTLLHVVEWMLDQMLERNDMVLTLGGGVIGDLAGFAGAIVRRGLRLVNLPTTLLAQVDSAIGGKTGINSPQGKNLIGTFHQPVLVISDTTTLGSLRRRDFLAGYGEVLKYGLLGDADFFNELDSSRKRISVRDTEFMSMMIRHSCQMKADIVSSDEYEHDKRTLLNLGHTFGHALEALTGYSDRLLHGEAVALGCMLAFELSARMGLCSPEARDQLGNHLDAMGMKTRMSQIPGITPTAEEVRMAMYHDKKVHKGNVHLILVRGIGSAFITKEFDTDLLMDTLHASAAP